MVAAAAVNGFVVVVGFVVGAVGGGCIAPAIW
jgi:hypothetical protein